MADTLTSRVIQSYDRLRSVRNMTGTLKFYQATSTTYTQLGSAIKAGWYAEFTEDRTTGEQNLQVLLAESDEWTIANLRDKATAIGLSDLRYKITGKRKPEGAPLVWILTCNSTGEAIS